MLGNRKNFRDKINEAAFDNYDPNYFEGVTMDRYDPNYADPSAAGTSSTNTGAPATNVQVARPGQKLNINLTLANPTSEKIQFEVFSSLWSWADIYKPNLAVGAYTVIPALSTEGLATVGVGTVGYDKDGVLNVYGGVGNPKATIGCGEYPYRSLQEATKQLPFMVVFGRISVQTDLQLNNQILHFTKTFAGGYKQNQINVRAYKKPTQFQNLEVDILAPFAVTGEKGLLYSLEVNETVQLSLFINRWVMPSID
jgi:hypothetical protein